MLIGEIFVHSQMERDIYIQDNRDLFFENYCKGHQFNTEEDLF
jgi:hypothetical protein